jgi:hypothetical protein
MYFNVFQAICKEPLKSIKSSPRLGHFQFHCHVFILVFSRSPAPNIQRYSPSRKPTICKCHLTFWVAEKHETKQTLVSLGNSGVSFHELQWNFLAYPFTFIQNCQQSLLSKLWKVNKFTFYCLSLHLLICASYWDNQHIYGRMSVDSEFGWTI